MASKTKRNIWRSKRLIIRPAESTDETFLQSLNDETSDGYQNATASLPVPQGAASAKGYREFLEKALLGCIICLPPPITPETMPGATASDSPANKPTPIGIISLMALEPGLAHHRKTDLGVSLAPLYQGQGYGSEAILWALEWAFRHANMHRVGIGAFAYNEGAWTLYERLGFVHEGRKREAIWYDGEYHDMVLLAIMKREWQTRYGNAKHDGKSG
jgi:ribosomal protein S18 acetylase RimI-like enzyme